MIDNKRIKIIISVVIGLGIASLFKRTCEGRNCIILKQVEDKHFIENNNYKFGNDCYKFNSVETNC